MSPLITLRQTIAHLRHRKNIEQDGLVQMALEAQLQSLYKQSMRLGTAITLQRDNEQRSRNERDKAAVKCGLRNAKENPGFKSEEGWHLKKDSANRLNPEHRLANFFRKLLGVEVPLPTLRKLAIISSKPSILLKTLDMEFISVIPDDRRKAVGDKLLKMIESKVN